MVGKLKTTILAVQEGTKQAEGSECEPATLFKRLEEERQEQEKLEVQHCEQEKLEAQHHEQEKLEAQHCEQEKLEAQHHEQEKLEAQQCEQEKLEVQHREQEKVDVQHLEQEKQEVEHEEGIQTTGITGKDPGRGQSHKQVAAPPSKGDGYFTPVSIRTRSTRK